jgi:predicted metal-dependent HD superfamily phosphohydrolase
MAILIDPARWPAHGTRFAHLASDVSLSELHAFARAAGVPSKAFDHDHYDVAEARLADLLAAGALPVEARELVRRVAAAGLRVRPRQRLARRSRAATELTSAWSELMPHAPDLGASLLQRWQEPHRHYHDIRHLFQMLGALTMLSPAGVPPELRLAAWFHDAVYEGVSGQDEAASADLARVELAAVDTPPDLVEEVFRLVMLTVEHRPDAEDSAGVLLVDADLSILGQAPGRYQMYVRDVRAEHPRRSDTEFGMARLGVVRALLSAETLYGSGPARRLWLDQAQFNLTSEANHWEETLGSKKLEEPT